MAMNQNYETIMLVHAIKSNMFMRPRKCAAKYFKTMEKSIAKIVPKGPTRKISSAKLFEVVRNKLKSLR